MTRFSSTVVLPWRINSTCFSTNKQISVQETSKELMNSNCVILCYLTCSLDPTKGIQSLNCCTCLFNTNSQLDHRQQTNARNSDQNRQLKPENNRCVVPI